MGEEMKKELIREMIMKERKELPYTLTPNDLFDLLPFGKSKIYEMIRTGEIPAKKVGGSIVIQRDLFLIWLYDTDDSEFSDTDISDVI